MGFLSCGISASGFLEEEAPRLEKWLKDGFHGKMSFMENHFDKRLNPSLLVDGAKSVISLLYNYYPGENSLVYNGLKISKYAGGEDYHRVLKDKTGELMKYIREIAGSVNMRAFTDSAPVMEKAWAAKSGLGWVGKNGNLISLKVGSFYFIAEIILDLELDYDVAISDHCGTCTRCIEACPTEAIVQPYLIDGSKCISYLTIELKDELIPREFEGKMENWIFGCDICQDVCPWNRFSEETREPRFHNEIQFSAEELGELTQDVFTELFKKSPLKRTGYTGLMRNIQFVKAKK